MNYLKHPLTSALIAILFVGCGGSSQDQGAASTSSRQVNGASVDGYLAGATVFADYDGDGLRDSFEPDAITDADGYFSYNPLTSVNYCASTATTLQQASCLKVNSTTAGSTSIIIRSIGGYDKSTGARSTASLAVKTTISDSSSDQAVSAVITPLTSIVANATSSAQRAQILTALDITEEDLAVDFLDSTNGVQSSDATKAANAAALLQKAVKLQKTAEVLSSALQNQYTELGKNDKLASDAGHYIYSQLTTELLKTTATTGSTAVDTMLADQAAMKVVIDAAQTSLRATYVSKEITAPTALGNSPTATAGTQAAQVSSVVDSVFTDVKTNVSLATVNSGLRAVEIVASKVKDQAKDTTDASVATAVTLLTGDATTRGQLLTALESNKFDLSALVSNNFTDKTTLVAAAALPDSATGFTSGSSSTDAAAILSGKSLRVNDPNNAISSKQKYGRIELYFSTTTGVTKQGPLTACIQYLDGTAALTPNATSDSDLKNSTTRGTYATGTWKLLGDGGYNMLVELKVAGENATAYQSRITSVGANDAGYKKFRFDFSGSGNKRTDATWLSTSGVETAPTTLPMTNAECKARFKDTTTADAAVNSGS